jgi:trigger factor
MPQDYTDETLRGEAVTFDVTVRRIQERILPDWNELPTLENKEGTLADLKHATSDELAKNARENAENRLVNGFIDSLVAGAVYDYHESMIELEADRILRGQEQEYARYGTTAEAVYRQMGRKREDLVAQYLPQGEERLKRNLAMREFVTAEGILVDDSDIDVEIDAMLESYEPEQRETMKTLLREQLVASVANAALDKKIRARVMELVAQSGPDDEPAAKKKSTKKAASTESDDAASAAAPKKKTTKKAE